MAKSENRKYYTAIVVAALIACAVVLRVLGKFDILRVAGGVARSLIYIALYIGWGISVYRRILYAPVRRYMVGVSFLAVLVYAANAEISFRRFSQCDTAFMVRLLCPDAFHTASLCCSFPVSR